MLQAKEALELVHRKLTNWSEGFVEMLPNFLLAVLILMLFWLVARVVRTGVKRLMLSATDSRTLRRLIGNTAYMIVMVLGTFAALSILHLDKTVTSILAGAGIMGLALSFAFQDIAANFVSGIIMAGQRPIRVGELIETSGHLGVVRRLDLRTTELINMQGLQVLIPNKDIFQTTLVNYSRNGIRRVDLTVGVSYGEDLENVERVTIAAVKSIPDRVADKEVELFYSGFGDSSINYEVRFWINAISNAHFQDMRGKAVKAIKAAYNQEGITIPFPIRTLDFGIKGGEKLSAMISERPRG